MGAWFQALNSKRRLLQGVLLSLMPPRADAIVDLDAGCDWLQLPLGNSALRLALHGPVGAHHAFINLHENERTSVQAAHDVLGGGTDMRGRLIILRGQRHRNVVFWIGLRPYLFDPNRIFSDAGIERTLRFHGAYSAAAHAALSGLRAGIVDQLGAERTTLVVALHNNGIGHYTIDSYLPGGPEAAEADAVHVDARADAGDFFLVTQRAAYDALCDSGFGVVLQRREVADNGSMSHHFTGTHPLYVNVEARHGHRREQGLMLAALLDRAQRLTTR